MAVNRRTAIKHLGSAAAVGALAGCIGVEEQDDESTPDEGGDDTADEGGTATVWYSLADTELPMREDAISQFNEQSNHTVEGADISDMQQKTTSAIPAGEGPKTFEWAHDWVGDYYQRGFVIGRDDLGVDLDAFTDAAAEAVQFDDTVVGLPHSAETVALVHNEDIVDEPPETVAEMQSIMDEFHDPDNGKYGLGCPFDPYFVSAWAQAFGGYYFDPEKDPMLGLGLPETIEGVQFALDELVPYMPRDPSYEPQAAAFADGNAAFAINGPWYLATLNEKGVDVGISKLPTPEDGSPNPYTGITMWYFTKAMEDGGSDTAAGTSFAEWYATNEELSLQAAEQEGSIPVLESLAGSDDLPPKVRGFSEAVEQGDPMPTHPKMNQVWSPVEAALIKVFNGDADVETAMTEADQAVRENWE